MGERKRAARKKRYSFFWDMGKRLAVQVLLPVLSLLTLTPSRALAKENEIQAEERQKALIVCRESTDASFLRKMAEALQIEPAVLMEEAYESGMAAEFPYVITTSPVCLKDIEKEDIPALCLKDACKDPEISAAAGKYSVAFEREPWSEPSAVEENFRYLIRAGDGRMGTLSLSGGKTVPFLTEKGRSMYVPFYRESGLGAVLLGNAMARLFQEGDRGRLYLAVDEVYPFSDLNLLCRMADLLYENGIPFIVRVMPVYENLDYPAFKRYAQVLRYVQAKNGTILIHPPLVRAEEIEEEPLEERLGRFTNALREENVFYVGYEYAPFLFSWEELKNIKAETKNFGTFDFPAMFTVPMDTKWEDFEDFVGQVNAKWLSLSDLKSEFTQEKYQYQEEPVKAAFEEYEEQKAGFQSFFDQGDKILLVVVGIGLVVFMTLIAIGTKWYRKKFMGRRDERG